MRSATDVFLISMFGSVCLGHTMDDVHNILNTILTEYNPDVRPVYDQSLPVAVNISTEIVNIKEFDEVSGQLTVLMIFYMEWTDTRLTWDPQKYNNTESITIPARSIWKPSLLLTSPIEESHPVGATQEWSVVKCLYDGTIYWYPADTISSSCIADVRFFPFDKQRIQLDFIPWGFDTNEILLFAAEDKVLLNFFGENGAWILADSLTESEDISGFFSMFSVTLVLQRRAEFFLVNAVLPVVFISVLNIMVFCIPVECGERVSYAITVYLALAVFMTIVGDNLPKNSKKMASICLYLLLNVAHSTLICFENIVCLVCFYRQGPVPAWLRRVISRKSGRLHNRDANIAKSNAKSGANTGNTVERKIQPHVSDDKWSESNCCEAEIMTVTWKDVSRTLDKIFGTVSIFILMFFVFAFTINIAMRKK